MAGVHLVDGACQSRGALVAAVVVGRGQHVETGMQNGVEIGGGSAEAGIAGVGWRSQCGLEIGYRQVGLLHGGFHQTEYVVEIVLAAAHMTAVQLGHVHHHVAAYEQRHFAHTVFQGSLGRLHLCRCRFLGAAAAQQHHEQIGQFPHFLLLFWCMPQRYIFLLFPQIFPHLFI